MRVLVTGAAGFIGTNLIEALLAAGHDVRALDVRPFHRPGVECLVADVAISPLLREAVRDMHAVVHLAAITGIDDCEKSPLQSFNVNAYGTLQLLEACRRENLRGRIVVASTAGAIANGAQCVGIRERDATEPGSVYGASKVACESLVHAYRRAHGLNTLALRFANVYGPHSWFKRSLISATCRALLDDKPLHLTGDGMQMRDFVSVADVCGAIVQNLDTTTAGVFNIGTGIPASALSVAKALERISGRSLSICFAPARAGDAPQAFCDMSWTRIALGWWPSVSLWDKGLPATWEWFAAQ